MKEFNGENPQNARMKLSYTGKKPKVKFSYPINKKDAYTGSMFFPIFFITSIILFLIIFGMSVQEDILDFTYNQTSLEKFTVCAITEFQYNSSISYYDIRNDLCEVDNLINISRQKIFLFLLIFILPSIIYFPFKKKWDKLYPDYEAFMARKKYRKFNEKDILINKEGKYYIELPVFKNIVCDFNATEEFSKYLEEFEIREYKFQYYRKIKLKSTKKKQRPKNEFLWYATWTFKQKPTTGFMEVIYK